MNDEPAYIAFKRDAWKWTKHEILNIVADTANPVLVWIHSPYFPYDPKSETVNRIHFYISSAQG